MKNISCVLFLIFQVALPFFAHEAVRQENTLRPEALSEKWELCQERYAALPPHSGSDREYAECLKNFRRELEKVRPDTTVNYYYPESENIYEELCRCTDELIDSEFLGAKSDSLRLGICSLITKWEALQKNLLELQLKSVYLSYRTLILVIVAAVLAALVFMALYLVSSGREKENRIFTAKMLQAQEAERERIACELHDTVCQEMRTLQLMQEDAEEHSEGEFKQNMHSAVELCQKIARDVRNSCYALTPTDLKQGLVTAVISLCQVYKMKKVFEIVLSIQDEIKNDKRLDTFSKEKNLHIYRIVQELLNNVEKHAKAQSASVIVRTYNETAFRIIVSDDGAGFDQKILSDKKFHFGLKNITNRSKAIGATVSYSTEPGEGTQVVVTVPYCS